VAEEWKERLTVWRTLLQDESLSEQVRAEVLASAIRPVPIRDQMRLQWTMIEAGVEQMLGEDTIQDAAVLVPIFRGDDGDLRVLIVRRTEGGPHGGQIAFPGGKPIDEDGSLLATALRETSEEIGVNPKMIEILEELPVVETLSTGFRIYPFLARVDPSQSWQREEREIAEILDVSVRELLRPENHDSELRDFPDRPEPLRISFYRVGQHQLWGATYRILRPLISRLANDEWEV
jgi:8-oxo-dGTP pyrophosphatase MutT (NUDIX family)